MTARKPLGHVSNNGRSEDEYQRDIARIEELVKFVPRESLRAMFLDIFANPTPAFAAVLAEPLVSPDVANPTETIARLEEIVEFPDGKAHDDILTLFHEVARQAKDGTTLRDLGPPAEELIADSIENAASEFLRGWINAMHHVIRDNTARFIRIDAQLWPIDPPHGYHGRPPEKGSTWHDWAAYDINFDGRCTPEFLDAFATVIRAEIDKTPEGFSLTDHLVIHRDAQGYFVTRKA